MVLAEELSLIKEVGIGAVVIYFGYLLFQSVLHRLFAQADKILELAEGTIKENTKALQQMQEILLKNIHSKDSLVTAIENQTETFVEKLHECKKGRDAQLQKIIESGKKNH